MTWVSYPDRRDSPYAANVRRYLPRGQGAIMAFGIEGGREAGQRCIEALELCSHLANVGDAKTLVIHPASTTHRRLDEDALAAAGVGEDMIRLSVGLEDPADLIWDLEPRPPAAVGGAAASGPGRGVVRRRSRSAAAGRATASAASAATSAAMRDGRGPRAPTHAAAGVSSSSSATPTEGADSVAAGAACAASGRSSVGGARPPWPPRCSRLPVAPVVAASSSSPSAFGAPSRRRR